jgi:hypothetical protein
MTPGAQAYLPGFYAGWSAPTPAKPGVIAQVSEGLPWRYNSFGILKLANDSGKLATQIIARTAQGGLMISYMGAGSS